MKLRLSGDCVIDTDDYPREGLRLAVLAMSENRVCRGARQKVEESQFSLTFPIFRHFQSHSDKDQRKSQHSIIAPIVSAREITILV